jgi:hypothetical protein
VVAQAGLLTVPQAAPPCSTFILADRGLDNGVTIDMNELNDTQKNQLCDLIAAGYNLSEMKQLCGRLGVDWEDISAETTRKMFAQELVSYFERRGWSRELIDQVWYDRPTMIQNSGLVELINYNDVQDEYVSTSTSSDGVGCLVGIIIVLVFLAIGWFVFSDMQKQQELRDSEAFVRGYFRLLDKRNHQSAWERLSGDYRVNKHSTGYTPYVQYWQSFKTVEVLKLEILEETDTTASIEVFLTLTKYDNTVVNQPVVYRLTRPTGAEPWISADSSP